jgi:iron complex transport system permease protein
MPKRSGILAWVVIVALLSGAIALSLGIGPSQLGGANLRAVLALRGLRLLLGILAGGVLAMVGASLQGLLRNPLVDPFTLGVASGAALGAAVTMALGGASSVMLPIGGFIGAGATILLVYLLARVRGRITATGLVLAGVIVSFLCSSLVMLVMILGRRTLGEAVYMMMGYLGTVFTTRSLWLLGGAGVVVLIGCGVLLSYARTLDIMAAGEEPAETLGVNTQRTTQVIFLVSSVLVGLVVAFTGAISFVGLVVPHLARLALGPGHRRLLPASFLLGAAMLLVSDVVARNIVPGGLPLSVVTALIGVPFFIYLLRWRL